MLVESTLKYSEMSLLPGNDTFSYQHFFGNTTIMSIMPISIHTLDFLPTFGQIFMPSHIKVVKSFKGISKDCLFPKNIKWAGS